MTALETQVGGSHYKTPIQPIEYIHKNNLSFIEGNIVKYITRWRDKGGVESLEKIKHYVDLLIELEGLNADVPECNEGGIDWPTFQDIDRQYQLFLDSCERGTGSDCTLHDNTSRGGDI